MNDEANSKGLEALEVLEALERERVRNVRPKEAQCTDVLRASLRMDAEAWRQRFGLREG